jgi:hypothetical protein
MSFSRKKPIVSPLITWDEHVTNCMEYFTQLKEAIEKKAPDKTIKLLIEAWDDARAYSMQFCQLTFTIEEQDHQLNISPRSTLPNGTKTKLIRDFDKKRSEYESRLEQFAEEDTYVRKISAMMQLKEVHTTYIENESQRILKMPELFKDHTRPSHQIRSVTAKLTHISDLFSNDSDIKEKSASPPSSSSTKKEEEDNSYAPASYFSPDSPNPK